MTLFLQHGATGAQPHSAAPAAPAPPAQPGGTDGTLDGVPTEAQIQQLTANAIALANQGVRDARAARFAPLQTHVAMPDLPPGVVFTQTVDSLVPVVIVIALVLGVLGFLRLRYGRARGGQVQLDLQPVEQRLERMEQAIQAIGVEVERISEGQRFVTRVLNDTRDTARLGRGE